MTAQLGRVVPFNVLAPGVQTIRAELDTAVKRVLDRGYFLMGPELQQFEQQFGAQFRQLHRTELHFMRLVCQPTKQQYEKIAADGETTLQATIKQFAASMRGVVSGDPDPRTPANDLSSR